MHTSPSLEAPFPAPTLEAKIGQDGEEVIFIGGFGNNKKEVNRVAGELEAHFGVKVLGRTCLQAFENPSEIRKLAAGSEEEGARHILVTSAGAAALHHAEITKAESVTAYAGVEKASPLTLPGRLANLFVAQTMKGWGKKWAPENEREVYRHAVKAKLREFVAYDREHGWNGWRYLRLLGKVARTSTIAMLTDFREQGIPAHAITVTNDEMAFTLSDAQVSLAQAKGVKVSVLRRPQYDHERIATHPRDVARLL